MRNFALTPPILQTLLAGLSRTVVRGAADDAATVETAAARLEAFQPGTPVQAMLAAQAVALHYAAIDCFGRAMQTPEEDGATITRLQRNGASLTRAFTATLHALQRCLVAAVQAAETEQQHPLQRELPVTPAKAGAQGSPPGFEVAALDPRFREDDGANRPIGVFAQNPLQREPLPRQANPAEQHPPHRRWEDLSEAEQFAILYPARVAAGATSHEDIDLWLPGLPQRAAGARSAR